MGVYAGGAVTASHGAVAHLVHSLREGPTFLGTSGRLAGAGQRCSGRRACMRLVATQVRYGMCIASRGARPSAWPLKGWGCPRLVQERAAGGQGALRRTTALPSVCTLESCRVACHAPRPSAAVGSARLSLDGSAEGGGAVHPVALRPGGLRALAERGKTTLSSSPRRRPPHRTLLLGALLSPRAITSSFF